MAVFTALTGLAAAVGTAFTAVSTFVGGLGVLGTFAFDSLSTFDPADMEPPR